MKRLILLFLFLSLPAMARERFFSFCEQGNIKVHTSGINSTNAFMGSFPSCTVRVTINGTSTLATLYSNNSGTPLANPFTANSVGFFFFYADDGRYDAQLSGGGLPSPWTIGDILLHDGANNSPSILDFHCVGDGVTNDTACIQSAINSVQGTGISLLVNGGKNFCVGTLTITGPLVLYGPGSFKRCVGLSTGAGLLDITGSNVTLDGFSIDGQTISPAQVNYSSNPTPYDATLTSNTSIWVHGGSANFTAQNLTINHTGGYAAFVDARTANISHVSFINNTVTNSRSTIFGTTAFGFLYGGWTGGFFWANDGTNFSINDMLFERNKMLRITGNTIWGHTVANTLQNTSVRIIDNYCEDTGLDCIQVSNVNGGVVSGNTGKRIGYVPYSPASPPIPDVAFGTPRWIPTTPFSIPAVMIDTSGIVTGVDYTDNSADAINGGWMDGDGYGNGTVRPGVGTSCWSSVDPHAQASLCGPGGSGVNAAYGWNSGNSAGSSRVDTYVNIIGGTFNGFGGGAIKVYGCSQCKVSNAAIYHPATAAYSPITYGPFTANAVTSRATNTEISNNTIYWSPTTGAMVAEDPQYAAFLSSDKNIVHDNRCIGTSGNACYELAKVPTTSTTSGPIRESSVTPGACPFPSFSPGPMGQSNCIIETILQTEGTSGANYSANLYADIGGTGSLIWSCNLPFGCTYIQPVVVPGLSVTGGLTLSGLTAGSGGTPICLQGTTVYAGGCGGGGGGGGLADPGANGPVYRTSLNVTAVATGAQLGSVFSGCTSGAPFLTYTGVCAAGGGGGGVGTGYATSATGSPQTILATTHGQGINPVTVCFSGALAGLATTGHQVTCDPQKNATGDVTVSYGAGVASIQIIPGSGVGGGGGGATIPSTTNLISGDGAGNGANSGIAPANVIQSTGSYANPSWITSLAYSKLTGVPVFQTSSINNLSQSTLNLVAGANITLANGSGGTVTISSTGASAAPYETNATGSPQTISAATHGQGIYPDVVCRSSALSSGNSVGDEVACANNKAANGDLIVYYTGTVASIEVRGTSGGSGGGSGAFSSITAGTNTGAVMVVGTGASLSATGSGTIAATTALAFASAPTGCTNQWATGIATNGNLTCSAINRVNGVLLAGLATGIVKNTTGTGVPSIAVSGTDYAPPSSGTAILRGDGAGGFTSAVASDVALLGNLSNNTTGTAALATALAATPTLCPSGQAPTGILANGNATGCASITGSSGVSTFNTRTGAVTLLAADVNSVGAITNNTSGNATTATALATTPTGCTNQWVTGIAANGNATCSNITRLNGVSLGGLATGILKNTTGTGAPSIAVAGDFPTLNQNTTGNAATASALAASPTLCTTGQAPTGILANGNATGCASIGGGSGSPGGSSGQVQYNNAGSFGGFTLGGDATLVASTGVMTLATVNVSSGACGSATQLCRVTTNAKGLVTTQSQAPIPGATDIRAYGATCNGSDQNTAVQAALNAGATNLWIPAGCTWILPTSTWSYNPGTGSISVAANTTPANVTFTGENWNTSAIKVASPSTVDMMMGAYSQVYSMSLVGHGCDSGTLVPGTDPCPNSVYNNPDSMAHPFISDGWQAVTTEGAANTDQAPIQVRQYGTGDGIFAGATYYGAAFRATTYNRYNSTVNTGSGGGCGAGTDVCWAGTEADFRRLVGHVGHRIWIKISGVDTAFTIASWISNTHITITTSAGNNTAALAALSDGGGVSYLANKFNDAPGFEIVEVSNGNVPCVSACGSGGQGFSYYTPVRTTGELLNFTQTTSTYNGTALYLDMAQGGVGTFNGNFEYFLNAGNLKWLVDAFGNVNAAGLGTFTRTRVRVTTVAGLGTCNSGEEGTQWAVTDAASATFLTAVTGGGSVHTPVYCNGTSWVAY